MAKNAFKIFHVRLKFLKFQFSRKICLLSVFLGPTTYLIHANGMVGLHNTIPRLELRMEIEMAEYNSQ